MSQQVKKIVSKITCVIMAAVFFVAGSFTFQEEYKADQFVPPYCLGGNVDLLIEYFDAMGVNQKSSYSGDNDYLLFGKESSPDSYTLLEITDASNVYGYMTTYSDGFSYSILCEDGCIDNLKIWGYDINTESWYVANTQTDIYWDSVYGFEVYQFNTDGEFTSNIVLSLYGCMVEYSSFNIYLTSKLYDYGWTYNSYAFDDSYVHDLFQTNHALLTSKINEIGFSSHPELLSGYRYIFYLSENGYYYLLGFDDLSLTLYCEQVYQSGIGTINDISFIAIPKDGVIDGIVLYKGDLTDNSWLSVKNSSDSRTYIQAPKLETYYGSYADNNYEFEFLYYTDFDLYFYGVGVRDYGFPGILYANNGELVEEDPNPPVDSGGDSDYPDYPESDSGSEDEWSGSKLPDDAIDDVGKAEDEILKPGEDIDLKDSLNVTVDENANAAIWMIIEDFIIANDQIFSLFIVMLSLGIVALILGR